MSVALDEDDIETLYKRVCALPSCKQFLPVLPELTIKWIDEDVLSGLAGRKDILLRVPRKGCMNTYPHLVALITHELSHSVLPVVGKYAHGKLFKDTWAILVSELLGIEFSWPKNGKRYYSCDDGWDVIAQMVRRYDR